MGAYKPLRQLQTKQSNAASSKTSKLFALRLKQLGNKYRQDLPEQIDTLTQKFALISTGQWSRQAADEIYQQVHKLAGAGGFFGFPGITLWARMLLDVLQTEQSGTPELTTGVQDELQRSFDGLLESMLHASANGPVANDSDIHLQSAANWLGNQ